MFRKGWKFIDEYLNSILINEIKTWITNKVFSNIKVFYIYFVSIKILSIWNLVFNKNKYSLCFCRDILTMWLSIRKVGFKFLYNFLNSETNYEFIIILVKDKVLNFYNYHRFSIKLYKVYFNNYFRKYFKNSFFTDCYFICWYYLLLLCNRRKKK